MSLKYLTTEEILRLHFQLIEDYGGLHGVRDEGNLKSLALAPKQNVFGKEQYPTIYEKAAVYLRNIIEGHPFTDGNRRTAITVAGIFLARNGRLLRAAPKELEDFTVEVAASHLDIRVIAAWFEQHTG